jgi:hypothetical protein
LTPAKRHSQVDSPAFVCILPGIDIEVPAVVAAVDYLTSFLDVQFSADASKLVLFIVKK